MSKALFRVAQLKQNKQILSLLLLKEIPGHKNHFSIKFPLKFSLLRWFFKGMVTNLFPSSPNFQIDNTTRVKNIIAKVKVLNKGFLDFFENFSDSKGRNCRFSTDQFSTYQFFCLHHKFFNKKENFFMSKALLWVAQPKQNKHFYYYQRKYRVTKIIFQSNFLFKFFTLAMVF